MRRIGLRLLCLLLLVNASNVLGEVFCVDTAEEIQVALNTAASNGQDDEVQIVQGTYGGNYYYESTESSDLAIFGGFSTDCNSRIIDSANTILDANNSNASLEIWAVGYDANVILQGLTLQNGNNINWGGGLYVKIGSYNSSFIAVANTFQANTARSGGGAYVQVYQYSNMQNSLVIFSNNQVHSNQANSGAGLSIIGNQIIVANNLIYYNKSDIFQTSGNDGGGLYFSGDAAIINNNIIVSNYARWAGGGISGSANEISVEGNIIGNNTAGNGGGTYVDGSYVKFDKNIIFSNLAGVSGGGILSYAYEQIFGNNFVHGNIAQNGYFNGGGGIYLQADKINLYNNVIQKNEIQNGTQSGGGGAWLSGVDIFLANNTFEGNINVNNSGALYLELVGMGPPPQANFYNNLFWGNVAYRSIEPWLGSLAADFRIIEIAPQNILKIPANFINNNFDQSPQSGYFTDRPLAIDPGNLNKVDPLFVDAVNDDLRLQSGSPMIDAGYLDTPDLPLTDLAGGIRVVGDVVDIGAYEYYEYEFCDLNQLTLDNETIGSGGDNYSSEVGIDTQGNVIISSDADVVLSAPVIQLNPGFSVEPGAQLLLRTQSVTCPQ